MANMYDISALSYDPQTNMEWFTRALFGGRLIQQGHFNVLTGIKGKTRLNQIDLQNKILQASGRDCAWTPNQIIKLSEKEAEVKDFKINLEQCIDVLEERRTAYMLSPGARNESLPDELEEATLWLIAINLSIEIEEMLIAGDVARDPNEFDGFQTILLKSAESIQRAGAVLTKENILSEIQATYDMVPEEVLQNEERGTLRTLISFKARRLLRSALGVASNQVLYPEFSLDDSDPQNVRFFFNGMEFVPARGLNKDTVIIYDSLNALFLTDLMSDLDDIRLGNFPAPKDNVVFIDGKMRLGFVVPFEDEVVISSPLIAEDREQNTNKDLQIVPNSLTFPQGGGTGTFTILTTDPDADVTANASGSGFTIVAAAKTTPTIGGVTYGSTVVTVTATDNTGSIKPKTGQVLVSIDDVDRSATVMLSQSNDPTVPLA